MLRMMAAATLAACLLASLVVAGCGGGGSGPGVGSIEGYAFGQIPSAAETKAPAIAVSRGPTPPAGYEPLASALVMVTGSSTIATTDDQGYFRIDNVVAGVETVTVSKSGYLTAVAQVTVVAGQLVTVADALLQPSVRKWTFLVFLNADNDLDEFGLEDVNEMEMVGSTPEMDIIVQMDRLNGPCVRMRVIHDNDPAAITSPVLPGGELGEVDMGDWRVLHDFIAWGMTSYPAEHYCLVIWNHGAGWRALTAPTENPVTRGVSFDENGTYITIPDLPRALDVHPRMDIIAFDASLMQMVEVAYQVRHFGGIMVGSEESPPGPGYPYQTFLSTLAATPTISPEDFATQIVQQTLSYYASIGFTSGLAQSAVSLANMDGVALAADDFARALATAMPAYSAQITSARTQAQHYAYPDNKDFYDFARLINGLVPVPTVTSTSQGVMQALQDAVFAEAHNAARANSYGLAIFIPRSTDYSTFYRLSYQQLEFSSNTFWDDWLAVSPS